MFVFSFYQATKIVWMEAMKMRQSAANIRVPSTRSVVRTEDAFIRKWFAMA